MNKNFNKTFRKGQIVYFYRGLGFYSVGYYKHKGKNKHVVVFTKYELYNEHFYYMSSTTSSDIYDRRQPFMRRQEENISIGRRLLIENLS